MSPKIVISKDGVRYPEAFAKRHGIEPAETRDTPSGADRTHTNAAVGTVVTDDAAGSVITSAAADNTSTTGVNQGLAAPVDAATAEAQAAEDAGKGSIGTTGEPDNTTAGGAAGESTTTDAADTTGESTTTTEDGAGDGGAASSTDGSGDADGPAGDGPKARTRSAKSK